MTKLVLFASDWMAVRMSALCKQQFQELLGFQNPIPQQRFAYRTWEVVQTPPWGQPCSYFLWESGGSIEPISRFTNLVLLILFSSPSRARFTFRSPYNCSFARCPIWTSFRLISIPQNSLTKKSKLMHKLLSCYQLLVLSYWMAESSYLTYCHI